MVVARLAGAAAACAWRTARTRRCHAEMWPRANPRRTWLNGSRKWRLSPDPLTEGIPEDETDRPWTEDERARRLMANLLGWHRREQKPDWWRYFNQLNDMTDEERLDAREPLAMPRAARAGGRDGTHVPLPLPGAGLRDRRRVRIRTRRPVTAVREGRGAGRGTPTRSCCASSADTRSCTPTSLVLDRPSSRTKAQEQNLLDIGRSILENGHRG